MMRSIRSKLIVVVSLLIVVMFSLTGYVLIDRKTKELTSDIYNQALFFAKMSTSKIIDVYRLYYVSQSFSYFNRDLQSILSLNPDISTISILSYQGELLFDSAQEKTMQYQGEKRLITDKELLNRIQDVKPSVMTTTGRVLYLLPTANGTYRFVDKNEKSVAPLKATERVDSLVFASGDVYRVLFHISYEHLDARIRDMMISMLILLVVSAFVGILVSSYFSSRIIAPVKVLMKGALQIGRGNLNVAVDIRSRDELKLLGDTFNTMARDLRNSTKSLIEKERMGKELEIARDIQEKLLPTDLRIQGLDVAAGVVPALEVGGDCFDIIRMTDDYYLFYVGDVTGHGVASGLVGSMANALIYSYSAFLKHPKDILHHTNRVLQTKTSNDMFVTMLMVAWNSQNNTLLYTQAGHDPLFYYHAATQELMMGKRGGIALGLVNDLAPMIQEEKLVLEHGDVVVIYTDGFPESFRKGADGKREILGFKRFTEIVRQAISLPRAQDIYDAILQKTKDFTGDYPQFDDMTLFVLKKV
jgi:hypothetical protein